MLLIHFQQFLNKKAYVKNLINSIFNNNPNLLLISFIKEMKIFLKGIKVININFPHKNMMNVKDFIFLADITPSH